ncbi:MAG: chemotaxis protein CheA [Gammaproteobacteria bacterium]|jgi:two-component system chemotaxis sensor kinase CheA
MSTDLKQFHNAFFEESFEALDDMESGLLNLDVDAVYGDVINTIFRAAHSIKGCSATFGFEEIASFVHVMETVLDEMRDQTLTPTQELVDLLLKALDVLRTMLSSTQAGVPVERDRVQQLTGELESYLRDNRDSGNSDSSGKATLVNAGQQSSIGWEIYFRPGLHLLQTGNDPLRMFRILSDLGDLDTTAITDEVPNFRVIDGEDCYLAWRILLKGETTEAEIREVFEWVEDECELDIKPISMENLAVEDKTAQSGNAVHAGTRAHNTADDNGSLNTGNSDSVSIRVDIDKVDAIINMVGELVITQSMLDQLGYEFAEHTVDTARIQKLREGLSQLERNTRDLQESVMRIRMLPISYVFNRVPRIVHDLSKKLNKNVDIKMTGEGTELDKTVLEKIGDPLVHLIRNAIDHGIEQPDARRVAGKPSAGTIFLNAFHKGGSIIVEIRDDGAGLNKSKLRQTAIKRGLLGNEDMPDDQQLFDLIFNPGFSTADTISDVSGRGVGMDVVRRNMKALGGNIEVSSVEGEGSCFTIKLPLTLAILDGQLARVGNETYIIPLISIIESLQIKPDKLNRVAGKSEFYRLRDEYISILRMGELLGAHHHIQSLDDRLMIVVEGDGKKVGLIVDDLLAQQQVVIKSLESNYRQVKGISGATILGDGTVALIADIADLIGLSSQPRSSSARSNDKKDINGAAA